MNITLKDITTVWVDLDDTIIDFTTNAHTALVRLWHNYPQLQTLFSSPDAWAEAYEHHNMALWALYSQGRVTRPFLRMERFRLPLTEAGMPDADARQLSDSFDTIYLDYLAQERVLMPGALDFLKRLRATGVRIGCLSNGFKEVQYRKMRTAGVDSYFDITVLSDDIGINKPDVRLFDYAMERVGDTDPAHHLMIGDNLATDIAGARAAGWHALWYHPLLAPQPSISVPEGVESVASLDDITLVK